MKDWGQVSRIIQERIANDHLHIQEMLKVKQHVEGDIAWPMYTVNDQPVMTAPVAQLVTDAINSNAIRASSVNPNLNVPPLDPSQFTGPRSFEYAAKRKAMYTGTYKDSRLGQVRRRGFRQLQAYGTYCLYAELDSDTDRAKISLRDALTTYPEPQEPEEFRLPNNIAFVYGKSIYQLKNEHPDNRDILEMCKMGYKDDDLIDVAEWYDKEHRLIGVIGPRKIRQDAYGKAMIVTPTKALKTYDNVFGIVPAATGKRVTLGRIMGAVTPLIPHFERFEQATNLWQIAMEKDIFPTAFLIGNEGRPPVINGGAGVYDGRSGRVNVVTNGNRIEILNKGLSPQVTEGLDRMERNIRMSSSNPGIFGGEAGGSIRSGQTVNQLGAYSIDGHIQEMQETWQGSQSAINEAVFLINKTAAKKRTQFFFAGTAGAPIVEVNFDEHLETPIQWVDYPFPGADVNQITVAIGQQLGADIISLDDARDMSPLVADSERTRMAILANKLENIGIQYVAEGLANKDFTFADYVNITKTALEKGDFLDAVEKAQKAAQERQATQAPAPTDPMMGAAPEAMPGMSAPGAGAEMLPPPQVGPPSEGMGNIADVLRNLQAPPGAVQGGPPTGAVA